ncbi:MAG TPA: EamA family transporter [Candidatus Norongarragalinales archaeon]|nr:EamA family transporter [Candidatus Norongarragalinales archaeon]
MKMDWLAFALAGMVLLSISNIMLKLLVSNPSFAKIAYSTYAIPIALAVMAVVSALFIASQQNPQLVSFAIGIAIFAGLGFAAMVLALEKGKVALVTAILSLSTILVAILSYYFLGDRFAAKEMIALALATLSIVVLVM